MEKQYWKLLDLPNQEGAEDSNEYVVRIIHLLEETSPCPPPSGGIGALLSSTMMGRTMETRDLHDKYDSSRLYPIVPRYPILKKMIKSVLRAPEFADICHEQTERSVAVLNKKIKL
ncbi:hypothetical protein OSTOST_15491 [Ostertagia ostertagi]